MIKHTSAYFIMVRFRLIIVLCLLMLFSAFNVLFAQIDTGKVLPKVTLTTIKKNAINISAIPVNQLSKEELNRINTTSVADAVRLFPGTNVKDYGGIGGLKTISVRSLGANHTGVLYDGLMISDMQGGQVDLGKIATTQIESLSLFYAQPVDMLLPARAYASASTMVINTTSATRAKEKAIALNAACRTGSFGFINPSIDVHFAFKKTEHRLSAEYQSSKGDYPFNSYDNSSETVKRKNSDAKNFRAEYDVTKYISDSNIIRLKAYQYFSDRGLPGSVIYFNPESRQRLTDRDRMVQATWRNKLSAATQLLLSGKYSHTYKYYLDPDFLNARGKLENRFHEKEYYGAAAICFQPDNQWKFSLANDVFLTSLTRSGEFIGDSANPQRLGWLSHLGIIWQIPRLEIQSGLLGSYYTDKFSKEAGKNIQRVNPTIAMMSQPFVSLPLQVRAFYKEVFRIPTFNDLYYTFVGNVNLRPESVQQYNFGLTFFLKNKFIFRNFSVTTDAYYNKVADKIMAVPRQNLFQWSMMNIGKVDINGIDAAITYDLKKIQGWDISGRFVYTYQKALDVSNTNSVLYKSQLPYTPEHSGSVQASIRYREFTCSYNAVLSSYRYRPGEQIPENLVQGWATQDVKIGWIKTSPKEITHHIFLELNNFLNNQYEIIRFYPMPRFNYRIGYSINIKNLHKSNKK